MNVVVTGAGKGIGHAIALKFAKSGHKVMVCARTHSDLIKLANLPEANKNISFRVVDMSVREEVLGFADEILDTFDKVDVLVNNAGKFIPGQIQNEEEGVLEAMIETNLYSAYHLTQALLPSIIYHKSGFIVNIGSTASITPYVNGGSYCISKHALQGFTKVLREELKPHNIKVTSFLPGATLTNSWSGVDLPSERFIQPDDIAELIYTFSKLSPAAVVEEILIRPLVGDVSADEL